MSTGLLRTSLYDKQRALGAKMVPFAGWEMPVQFEGILKEHEANRQGCSIFDCSHMGEFLIEGEGARAALDRIVTQKVLDMTPGTCRYGMALNDQGGTIDDLIVYCITPRKWMVVVNAANITKDREHFERHLGPDVTFTDISVGTAKLDVQGPLSREVLSALVPGIQGLSYYTFGEFDLLGEKVVISRTGYTGELGFEIYYPWDKAERVWDQLLLDARVRPTGLGVRDVLRIEVCYPLYGHELSEEISPFDAGLRMFVDQGKDFIGKQALLTRPVPLQTVCVLSDSRRAPRQGQRLYSPEGSEVGEITSGTFSPALGFGIGLGFVKKTFTSTDKVIIFGDEKFRQPARIVTRPFYKEGSLKN
ncbi:MAG: glycine cleavage system aminomethyltransferase GcvT [Elusimicrobia bacterium]|nr:glycine cleavage system aminomethyltransferase GcvT [Elusimicrobiota bacterium]